MINNQIRMLGLIFLGMLFVWGSGGAQAQTVNAPTNLNLTLSGTFASLTWTDNSNNELNFRIERSSDGATWTQIAAVNANITTYNDKSLACYSSYQYRVRAYSGSFSTYSNSVSLTTGACTPLLAPNNLRVTAEVKFGFAHFAWDDSNGNTTAYIPERSDDNGLNWTVFPQQTWLYLRDQQITCGAPLLYRVRAYRSYDTSYSPYSETFTLNLPCAEVVNNNLCTLTGIGSELENQGIVSLKLNQAGSRAFVYRSSIGADIMEHIDTASGTVLDNIESTSLYDVSDAGRLVYVDFSTSQSQVFIWENGVSNQITNNSNIETYHWFPSISRDGSKVVFLEFEGFTDRPLFNPSHIYLWEEGLGLQVILPELSRVSSVTISGDGNHLVFASYDDPLGEDPFHYGRLYRWDATNGIRSLGALPPALTGINFMADFITVDDDASHIAFQTILQEEYYDGGGQFHQGNLDIYIWTEHQGFQSLLQGDTQSYWNYGDRYFILYPSDWSADGGRLLFTSVKNLAGTNDDASLELFFYQNGSFYQISSDFGIASSQLTAALSSDGQKLIFLGDNPQPTNTENYSQRQSQLILGTCTPPPAPVPNPLLPASNLSASLNGTDAIDLTWTDNASDETTYYLEQSLDNGLHWSQIAQIPADSTSYSASGLACGLAHQYRLRAYRAADSNYSLYSNVATAVTPPCVTAPSAPSNLTVLRVAQYAIDLRWIDNAQDESYIHLERSSDDGTTWDELPLPADTETFTDSWVTCYTDYQYRLRSYRESDDSYSTYSQTVTTKTLNCPLPAPSNLSASNVTQIGLTLNWLDNSSDEANFQVGVTRPDGGTYYNYPPANTTSYPITALQCNTTYTFSVAVYRAYDALYSEAATLQVTTNPCIPIAAPTNLTMASNTFYSISLSWEDNASNEVGYKLERSSDAGATWTVLSNNIAANATTTINGTLTCGTSYQYRLRAYATAADTLPYSEYSNVLTASTLACLPPLNAPSNLTITSVTRYTVGLAWDDNASDETYYRPERSSDNGLSWNLIALLATDTTTYLNAGLSCGTTYLYRVRAYRGADYLNSTYSNTVSVTTNACTPLNPPSNLALSLATPSSLAFTWTDNEIDETNYLLERSINGGSTWSQIASLAANTTSYTNTSLSCNTSYQYRLRANYSPYSLYSAYSTVLTASTSACPPNAPTSLNLSSTGYTNLAFTWVDNATNESGFSLERSADSGATWSEIATPATNATSYNDLTALCSSTYQYRIRAYRSSDSQYSAYSNVRTATTLTCLPSAPSGLNVTSSDQTSISLAWTDNATTETGYRLERSANSGVTWAEIAQPAADATSYSNTALSCNTSYQYRVRAYRSSDSQYSAYSNVVTASTTACPAPLAPTGLVITSTGYTNLALAWTDNASDETAYRLERSSDAGSSWSEIASTAANATSYNDSSALCNSTYHYRVRVYRAGDSQYSAYSNVVSGTSNICITLNAPTNIQLTSNSQTSLTFTWADNSTNESGYDLERSLNGSNWTLLSSLPANSTSYTDSGLNCTSAYYYRLRSNHLGTGSYSPYGTSGLLSSATCPALLASVLSSTGATQSSISISWTADTNGTSFTLAYYNGTAWVNLGIFPSSTTTYTQSGLICSRSYAYQVTAFRTADSASVTSGAFSTNTATCPPLTAPLAPLVVNTEPTLVSLQMPALPSTATSMSLERSSDGSTWTNLGVVSGNYLDTAVACGSSYQYRLVASRSSDGITSTSSSAVAITDACPIPTVVGVYRNGLWVFVDSNNTTVPTNSFNFGDNTWQALVGDWDGDGVDGVGIYRNGEFVLRNIASADAPENRFNFGAAEAGWQALVGDWNGDGIDSIGLYKEGLFTLSDDNVNIQYRFNFGNAQAAWQVLAGDWDGNGADGIGLYKEGFWFLAEDVNNPDRRSQSISYGPTQAGWLAIVGDWNGDGRDSIGLYNNGLWRMRVNSLTDASETTLSFGQTGDTPLTIFEAGGAFSIP